MERMENVINLIKDKRINPFEEDKRVFPPKWVSLFGKLDGIDFLLWTSSSGGASLSQIGALYVGRKKKTLSIC